MSLKHVFEPVDLSQWNLDAVDSLRVKFLEAVSEAIQHAINEGAQLYFAHDYGEGDADVLRLTIPLGYSDAVDPSWEISLTTMTERLIERYERNGKIVDAKYIKPAEAIRDALRNCADMIDGAIERDPKRRRK